MSRGDAEITDRTRLPAAIRLNLQKLGGCGRGVIAVSGGADSVAPDFGTRR